ncbi:HtrB Lauroyl/myristoyl acyltransferase [Burkholderiaceae bacterium]
MKRVHFVQALGKIIGYCLCRLLPIDWVSNLGAKMGRYREAKENELRPRVEINLKFLGVDRPSPLLTLLKAENGRAALEMLIADRIARVGRVRWIPNQELDHAIQQKRPIIFCCIHLSNLGDVVGASIVHEFGYGAPDYRMGGAARQIADPIDRWIANRSRRLLLGKQSAWVSAPKPGLARQILDELLTPPSILMLHVDESRKHQVHCPSFGRELPKGINLRYAVKLAMRSKACLVPLYLLRDPNATAHFTVHTIRVMDFNSVSYDEQEAIQTIDQDFEQIVRRYPERWLQIYHARLG